MLAFLKNSPSKKQITWIKVIVFLVCLIPLLRLVWLGFADNLTANPIEFIERSTGFWALFILLATISLTPIRLLTGRVWQIQLRRMLGLFMFFYVCLHIITYVWLDFAFDWLDITKDIAKHPRILVGFAAFLLTVPLALTSSNSMMKRLRERWKQLHQMVYIVAILAIVHFWWLVKKDIREPLLYACILMVLFGIRIYYKYMKNHKSINSTQINNL
ncbi:MAG: sulfoxide reductase heme-binding subunit YedZ [Methylotenera sp.]|uniref:sulfite oxidase heme-binding subunit YedZ n=1 Tax=Methylotenera sp. TaxID=2051956 RepID=UPI0024893511|nr:protein-methionine-sulfoxide reductase heme-binding subunit MsrQ [Methylotenera sp.]MDI1309841.1 sulfoxide reductase heme-binding subunit YedZ [Methylotenera sp.]